MIQRIAYPLPQIIIQCKYCINKLSKIQYFQKLRVFDFGDDLYRPSNSPLDILSIIYHSLLYLYLKKIKFKQMIEESDSASSKMDISKEVFKNKNVSKLSMYETNMQNYSKNLKFTLEKIDPKGISSVAIFASFSGVFQSVNLFSNCDETLQISYKVYLGNEWHDQTPETDDTEGQSHFCQSKGGKISFSLGFDFLVSSMYVTTWPKIIFNVKGFNRWGQLVPRGYAQLTLPSETGMFVKQAYIYSIIRNQKWYHRWIPFLEAEVSALQESEIQKVIVNGEGRQLQKVKSIGILNIRVQTLIRNFQRYGYK